MTRRELFSTGKDLVAAYDSFERHNQRPREVLSILGSDLTAIARMYLEALL